MGRRRDREVGLGRVGEGGKRKVGGGGGGRGKHTRPALLTHSLTISQRVRCLGVLTRLKEGQEASLGTREASVTKYKTQTNARRAKAQQQTGHVIFVHAW